MTLQNEKLPLYVELLDSEMNSYELKMFRVQHDETQLTKYLCKFAKKHQKQKLNKIYLVRTESTGTLVAWFALKSATLPYNDKAERFLTPAIELTHFAVDERYKLRQAEASDEMRMGEFIFWNFILPIAKKACEYIACKDLFVFAINHPKLIEYYKSKLGFREIKDIDDKQFFEYAAPEYDSGCKFLYFPLGD